MSNFEIVGDKRDILTEIIEELSRYNVFQEDKSEKFFESEYLFVFVWRFIKFCSFYFIIFNYKLHLQCIYEYGKYTNRKRLSCYALCFVN